MKAEEATLAALNDLVARNGTLTANQSAMQKAAAGALVDHTGRLKELQQEHRGMGQAALQASYAFQDLTSMQGDWLRGLMAIQNNIPGIITSLGGNAGLAGAISIVSVGIGLALPHIMEWAKSMKLFGDSSNEAKTQVEKLKESLKELEKKTVKLEIDRRDIEIAQEALDRLQKAEAAWKAAHETKGLYEKESGSAVAAVLANAPGGEGSLVDQLTAARVKAGKGLSPAIKDAQERAQKAQQEMDQRRKETGEVDVAARTRRDAANQDYVRALGEIERSARDTVGGLIGGAKSGDQEALKRLAALMAQTKGAEGVGRELSASSADAIQAGEQEETDFDRHMEAARRGTKKRAAKEKAGQPMDHVVLQWKERQKQARKKAQNDNEAQEAKDRDSSAKAAATRAAELAKGLGDQFLASAESHQLGIDRMPYKSKEDKHARDKAQRKFSNELQRAAERRLTAGGVDPSRAAELAGGAGDFVRSDIAHQAAQFRVQNPQWNANPNGLTGKSSGATDAQVLHLLEQLLANQARQAAFQSNYQEQIARIRSGANAVANQHRAMQQQQHVQSYSYLPEGF